MFELDFFLRDVCAKNVKSLKENDKAVGFSRYSVMNVSWRGVKDYVAWLKNPVSRLVKHGCDCERRFVPSGHGLIARRPQRVACRYSEKEIFLAISLDFASS